MTNRTPSTHADIIKAWADGYTIEYKGPHCDQWRDILPPGQSSVSWQDDIEYRVKVELTTWYVALKMTTDGHPYFTAPVSDSEFLNRNDPYFVDILTFQVDPVDRRVVSSQIVSRPQDEVTTTVENPIVIDINELGHPPGWPYR